MRTKTLDEEIPVTKPALLIYRDGLLKELKAQEKIINHLNLAIRKTQEALDKMK